MMNHTENPDFNRLLWGIPLFIAACLLIAAWAGNAKAQLSGYYVRTTLNYATDSSATVDSCRCYRLDGSNVAALDSADRLTTTAAILQGYGTDQLTRYAIITPATISSSYNPVVSCNWYMSNGAILRDGDPTVSHVIFSTDTLITGVAATATIDYDTLASIVNDTLTARHPGDWAATGGGGTGAFPETLFVYDSTNGALVQGATIHIKAADTGSYQNSSGPQATNSSGYAIFSIDAGTFPVAADAQTYFQAGAYQLVTQASPGGRDTVFLYAFAATPPSGGDSCTVVAFTNNSGSTAEITLATGGMLQDTSGVFLTPKVDVAQANGLGVISFTLPRTAATRQNTIWKVTIKDQDGTTIGEVPKYEVPSQAIDTIWVVTKAKP